MIGVSKVANLEIWSIFLQIALENTGWTHI
jgi:hypothetical protein